MRFDGAENLALRTSSPFRVVVIFSAYARATSCSGEKRDRENHMAVHASDCMADAPVRHHAGAATFSRTRSWNGILMRPLRELEWRSIIVHTGQPGVAATLATTAIRDRSPSTQFEMARPSKEEVISRLRLFAQDVLNAAKIARGGRS